MSIDRYRGYKVDRRVKTGIECRKLGLLYLQAASRTVLCDDTHIWWVDASPDEAGQVFILNITHLQEDKGCWFKSHQEHRHAISKQGTKPQPLILSGQLR